MERSVEINGKTLRNCRIDKGWRVEDLASRAGVSTKTIQNMENGKKCFLATVAAVAQALQVRFSLLMAERFDSEKALESHLFSVQIHIDKPFPEFDASDELVEMIETIQSRLPGINISIHVKSVREGSVILTIELNYHDLEEFTRAVFQGIYDDLGISYIVLPPAVTFSRYDQLPTGRVRRHPSMLPPSDQ